MGGDAADEEAFGEFVQSGGASEEAGQQGRKRSDGCESAIIFYEKWSAEIGVASLNAGAGLADLEVALHVVVAQAPSAAVVGLGADFAQGLENFEQADVVTAFALDYGESIVGGDGVDGEALGGRGGRRGAGEEQGTEQELA